MYWLWFGRIIVALWSLTGWAYTIYMIYFYLANYDGDWKILSDLNGPTQKPLIYLHIIGATLVLLLGPIQMINNVVRLRSHIVTGLLYTLGCLLSSLGGLGFIVLNGTVGGVVMTTAFSVAGILTFLFTLITCYFAVERDRRVHRNWAIRLYALASSSVFYRLLYFGLYRLIRRIWGPLHWQNFQSPLDLAFNWLYFMVPMILTELYLWVERRLEDM